MPNISEASGEYVLPVGMTDLQKKVTSAVVSSNFSEILSYFDGNEQSHSSYKEKLTRMMVDLNLVANHPYLLLSHLQPSLAGKRAPSAIENMSGKFQSLVTLAKKFNKPDQHVAVVCEAGQTTDLVESVLSDRALNITRYSSPSQVKLYKKEIQKRRGATFHLVPSELKDLKQAVYAAFDVMIVMDNTFDVHSNYGRGLRAQLRDPLLRRPFASIIRLVALNTAQHIQLISNLSFSEQIASVVVLKKNAGAMPSIVKQFYARDMTQLNQFVSNPDGPYPLPEMPQIKRVGHKEVEMALYLDDEDQYQVDFANRKVGGRRKAAHASAEDMDSDEEDSGSDEAKSDGINIMNISTDEVKPKDDNSVMIPSKRRRIELEDHAVDICEKLSTANPFSIKLLIDLNDCLIKDRLYNTELESHRGLASNRELAVETQRVQMQSLAGQVLDLQKQNEQNQRRAEKLATRNEKLEAEIEDSSKWWSEISQSLKLSDDENNRCKKLVDKVVDLKNTTEHQQHVIDSEKSRYAHLETVSNASSSYATELAKERDNLLEQLSELKSRLEDEPKAKELAIEERLRQKTVESNSLRAELENLKESVKIQLSTDRASTRGERRFGGRGGRGSGLNKHSS